VTPADILVGLLQRGFAVRVTGTGNIGVSPAEQLSEADVVLIRQHRAELLELLAGRGCRTCRHRTSVSTCGEPEAAGLVEKGRFSICWCCQVPETGRHCPAWAPGHVAAVGAKHPL
jgi:hypothetical protein